MSVRAHPRLIVEQQGGTCREQTRCKQQWSYRAGPVLTSTPWPCAGGGHMADSRLCQALASPAQCRRKPLLHCRAGANALAGEFLGRRASLPECSHCKLVRCTAQPSTWEGAAPTLCSRQAMCTGVSLSCSTRLGLLGCWCHACAAPSECCTA